MLFSQIRLIELLFLVLDFSKFSTNSSPVCFLCNDFDCIQPPQTQNVKSSDKHWYLCDDHPHCKDGTDEDHGKIDT